MRHLKLRSRDAVLAFGLTAMLIGCDDKAADSTKDVSSNAPASGAAKPVKAAEETVEQLAESLETEEDFEISASEEITAENLEAELAKLEKELE